MAIKKRKIITIDQEKCDGCGKCITACAEGALKLVNGKATLVSDTYCDGFGDCLGECPTGALKVVEREAPEFDMEATRTHVEQLGGAQALQALDAASRRHDSRPPLSVVQPLGVSPASHGPAHRAGGCPGSMMRNLAGPSATAAPISASSSGPGKVIPSELTHWPIQIHLVRPDAPFFKNRELVVMSTCGPIASADVHWRFIRGRSVVVGCPKLDRTEGYPEKLAQILSEPSIPKVIVVRMEVPCCGGLTSIVREAVAMTGRSDLVCEEVFLGLNGEVQRVAATA